MKEFIALVWQRAKLCHNYEEAVMWFLSKVFSRLSPNRRKANELVVEASKHHGQIGPEHFRKMQECYEKALTLDPDNWEALYWLGRLLGGVVDESGAYVEDSVRYLRRATELNPGNSDVWVWLSASLFNRGRKKEAGRALEKALSIDPCNSEAHFHKMLYLDGPQSEKDNELLLCLRYNPNHPLARLLYRRRTGKEYNGT